MTVLNWVAENWVNLFIVISVFIVVTYKLIVFSKLPESEKIKNVKEWLVYAVAKAEKELGSKTGVLKLRLVYDRAVERFTWLSIVVPFETFSKWVDDALVEMEELLKKNQTVADYVESGK